MERFSNEPGCHYDPKWLCELTDEELVEEIEASNEWDAELCREACYRAGLENEFDVEYDIEWLCNKAVELLKENDAEL